MKKPMPSVTKVRMTLDPSAGSRPARRMPSGTPIPTAAATSRLRSVAIVHCNLCRRVIDENPGVVADYKGGKTASINFLKGQVM